MRRRKKPGYLDFPLDVGLDERGHSGLTEVAIHAVEVVVLPDTDGDASLVGLLVLVGELLKENTKTKTKFKTITKMRMRMRMRMKIRMRPRPRTKTRN